MGSPENEADRSSAEGPQHEVEITRPFYLGVQPVTQSQWRAVMGSNPSYFSAAGGGRDRVRGLNTDDFPVESVNWDDAGLFLSTLSSLEAEREVGRDYRLPTEAEWEYACRGLAYSSTPFHFGMTLSSAQANFLGYSPTGGGDRREFLDRPSKVGSYRANGFGLLDLHGNVWEWCADWYSPNYYAASPWQDPPGAAGGTARVFRGGSWNSWDRSCRSAIRMRNAPGFRLWDLGFRVALTLPA
jgi:formylglycine-generating enzyme required for sulfatase activity